MKRVLIVDDTIFLRYTIKLMLEKNGYTVAGEAENGEVAISKYMQLKPDIVTMDITMPIMDGIQALREIRKIDPDSKVIMVSAMGQLPFVQEAVMLGAKGFIVKPFKEEQLMKVMSVFK